MISDAAKNSYAWPHFGETPKDAQTLLDEARTEAWNTGLEEGREKAYAEAQADIQTLKTHLQCALRDLEQVRFRVTTEQVKQLARVSYDINRLILGSELKTNLEIFSRLLGQGVELIASRDSPIRVIVSAADQHWLESKGLEYVTIVASENQAPGTLRIENDNQSVEFDPYDQLAQLYAQALQGHIDLVEEQHPGSEQPGPEQSDSGSEAATRSRSPEESNE